MHLNDLFRPIFPVPMIIIIFLIGIPISFSANDDQYTACTESYQCVSTNITYPFWGGRRPESCGHSGFELDCSGDAPQITIADTAYRVLNISDSTQNLTLARLDYWNDYCPSSLVNSTIDFALFNYTSSTNISIYYDCPTISTALAITGLSSEFTCNINGTNTEGYFVTQNSVLEEVGNSLWSCVYEVLVPVFQSASDSIENNATSQSLIAAIDGGFGLIWNANDSACGQCSQSGGACGQDTDSGEFRCYCSDGAYESICGGMC